MAKTFAPSIKRVAPTRSAEAAIRRGKKLLSEKRFEEALAEFEGVVQRDQATPFVHSAIGRIKFKQKDFNGSLHHFKTAIKLDPTLVPPYLRVARIYVIQGELEEAKENLQNAIRVNPNSAVAYAGLGAVLLREKQPEQAIEQLQKALKFNPRILMVRKRLATAFSSTGNSADAMVQIKSALRIKPDDAEAYAIKGRLHMTDKDYDAAQEAYSKAVELLGSKINPVTYMGLAEAYIQGGKLVQAEQVLNQIPQRDQFSAFLHKLWGDLYNSKGMHREAVEEYRAASLKMGEDLGIEGLETTNLLADESDDEKWEELAASASSTAADFVEKKRQQVTSKIE